MLKNHRNYALFLLAATLVACQVPLLNSQQLSKQSENTTFAQPIIRSATQPDLIRKTIVSENLSHKNSFSVKADIFSNQLEHDMNAQIEAQDLNRIWMLTLKYANPKSPNGTVIYVNGKKVFEYADSQETLNDLTIPLENLKENDNQIKISVKNNGELPTEADIVGFVKPEDIPRAVHSRIPDDADTRKAKYRPGRVGIKFLEGMDIETLANAPDSAKDKKGLSLTTLKQFMRKHQVKAMSKAIGGDTLKWNNWEIKSEEVFQTDVANMNLFYYLEVDKAKDLWPLIDELRKLPYIEEAYPEFELKPAAPYTPNDPLLGGSSTIPPLYEYTGDPLIPHDLWLRNMHLMQNRTNTPAPGAPGEPGPDDDGAWSITQGNPNVKVAHLDYGAQIANLGSYIPTTHEDLGNVTGYSNINFTGTDTGLIHGTSGIGTLAATGNNGIGVAGTGYGVTKMFIHAAGGPLYCNGGTGPNCGYLVDSMIWAHNLGAKVISHSFGGIYPIEHLDPAVRAASANLTAQGTVILHPAGNHEDKDIRKFNGTSSKTPDTGSIFVGGLKVDGSKKEVWKNDSNVLTGFNYGKSTPDTNPLYTNGGHGTDVSGPAECIRTTSFTDHNSTNKYDWYHGTSGATPAVAGVVALMLSVKPDLTPLEIRKTLRETADTHNSDNICFNSTTKCISGMVNAYKAVSRYSGGSQSGTQSGLYAKYYDSTTFPPEVVLNELPNNGAAQHPHIPYATAIVSSINYTSNVPNPFNSNLKFHYVADFQGLVNITNPGNYSFAVEHDDYAQLSVDGSTLLKINNNGTHQTSAAPTAPYLSAGLHQIKLIASQNIGNTKLVLKWLPPGASSYQVIPSSALSHSTAIYETATSTPYESGVVGRFFDQNSLPLLAGSVSPFGSKEFSTLDFYPGPNELGDQFGIGRTDNFGGHFSGYIKLPATLSAGTYPLYLRHDDGVMFYLDGQLKINEPNSTGEHSTSFNFQSGAYYPFTIHYKEVTGNAHLKLWWTPPGLTKRVVSYNALWH